MWWYVTGYRSEIVRTYSFNYSTQDLNHMSAQNVETQVKSPIRFSGMTKATKVASNNSGGRRNAGTTRSTKVMSNNSGVIWEFEDGNSGSEKWIKYLPQDATILENAFISKKSTVQVTNKYGTYSITLPSGTSYGCQVKQGSGFRRRVRRRNKTQQQQQLKKITTAPVVAFGKMTQDFDGAKRLVSASSQGYILLAFSGSDWCGWCKIMDQNVFAKTEWEKKSVCCFFFFLTQSFLMCIYPFRLQ